MNTVPSTPTAADANAERQIIQKDIVTLMHNRDRLRNEVGLWERAHTAVKREVAANGGLVGDSRAYEVAILTELDTKRAGLATEIQTLEDRKRSLETTHGALATSLPEKKREHASLDGAIQAKRTEFETLSASKEKMAHEHSEAVTGQNEALAAIEARLIAAKKQLAEVETTEEEKTAWILGEEERLATKGADLAIYERRIRAMAVEVGMDPNSIIT